MFKFLIIIFIFILNIGCTNEHWNKIDEEVDDFRIPFPEEDEEEY